MINPHRIKYNNIFSNELNMPDLVMCAAMNGDDGETSSFLSREAVSSETHDGRYKRIHRFKYTETFAPKFTFLKKDFGDFEMNEVRSVLKWLTSKDTTSLLEVYYDNSNVVAWASIGGFVDLQTYKLTNNRTVAITATWDSISPFCMSDLYSATKTIITPEDNKITINIDTDDNKPVYPRVKIQHNGSIVRIPDGTIYTPSSVMIPNTVYFNGTTYYWKTSGRVSGSNPPSYDWDVVTIDNKDYSASDVIESNTIYYYTKSNKYYWIDPYHFHERDDGVVPSLTTTSVKLTNTHTDFFEQSTILPSVIVKNSDSTETVLLDGANKIISSSNVRRIFGDDFENWTWLELRDGRNEITIEGNCTVTIEWREVRKIGEW